MRLLSLSGLREGHGRRTHLPFCERRRWMSVLLWHSRSECSSNRSTRGGFDGGTSTSGVFVPATAAPSTPSPTTAPSFPPFFIFAPVPVALPVTANPVTNAPTTKVPVPSTALPATAPPTAGPITEQPTTEAPIPSTNSPNDGSGTSYCLGRIYQWSVIGRIYQRELCSGLDHGVQC